MWLSNQGVAHRKQKFQDVDSDLTPKGQCKPKLLFVGLGKLL